MTTRAEAIEAAGRILADGVRAQAQLSVADAARAAYTPTGPPVDELERRIAAQRAAAVQAPTAA